MVGVLEMSYKSRHRRSRLHNSLCVAVNAQVLTPHVRARNQNGGRAVLAVSTFVLNLRRCLEYGGYGAQTDPTLSSRMNEPPHHDAIGSVGPSVETEGLQILESTCLVTNRGVHKTIRQPIPVVQGVFGVGIAMFLAYYGYYQLWAVFFPTLLSLLLMLWLIGLKVRFEEFPRRRAAGMTEAGGEDPGGGSGPLGQHTRRSAAAGPAGDSKNSEMQPLMSSW